MKEIEKPTNQEEQDKIYWEALEKYQKLLDHYKVSANVQEVAWSSMLETPEEQAIREIENYWQETFGSNGKGNKEENTNKNQVDLQTKIYQSRKLQWHKYLSYKKT
jgi:hypothetical protein